MNDWPFVSVVIPCRNEKNHIRTCLSSLEKLDYPTDRLEIIIVDGLSDDNTRDILAAYASRIPHLRLLDNPARITPAAMNIGIRAARGEYIVRMDAHSEFPPTFLKDSINILAQSGADVVGGPVETCPGDTGLVAQAIALATSHAFGVGNSAFRTSGQ